MTAAAGSSPLIEQLPSDATQVTVTPGFGNIVQIAIHGGNGMPEVMPGAVAAVTIYGDGRIEYHPVPAAPAEAKATVLTERQQRLLDWMAKEDGTAAEGGGES